MSERYHVRFTDRIQYNAFVRLSQSHPDDVLHRQDDATMTATVSGRIVALLPHIPNIKVSRRPFPRWRYDYYYLSCQLPADADATDRAAFLDAAIEEAREMSRLWVNGCVWDARFTAHEDIILVRRKRPYHALRVGGGSR